MLNEARPANRRKEVRLPSPLLPVRLSLAPPIPAEKHAPDAVSSPAPSFPSTCDWLGGKQESPLWSIDLQRWCRRGVMAQGSSGSGSEPMYGGYTRFELELEVCIRPPTHLPMRPSTVHLSSSHCPHHQFVQSLANPAYVSHLASQKYLDDPAFVAYLSYLQYFREPRYAARLTYPGPTLRALELLQQPRFRDEIRLPELVYTMMERSVAASFEAH
ncbi:MAG: hypothetical protein INR71_01470 [Terriglobus roseus]|nr:hypothetical protein [Terriglobus roseus]